MSDETVRIPEFDRITGRPTGETVEVPRVVAIPIETFQALQKALRSAGREDLLHDFGRSIVTTELRLVPKMRKSGHYE